MSKILLVEDNPDAVKRIIRYINKIYFYFCACKKP